MVLVVHLVYPRFGWCEFERIRSLSHTGLQFLAFFLHLFALLLRLFLVLDLVSKPVSSCGPSSCDPPPVPVWSYVREYASYLDAWRFLTPMQAIVRWLSTIVTSCCAIPMLGHGSSFCCSAVVLECLCCVSSIAKLVAHLFAVIKRWDMKRIFQHLCNIFIGIHYPNLKRHMSFCIVCLVTSSLPSAPNIANSMVNDWEFELWLRFTPVESFQAGIV